MTLSKYHLNGYSTMAESYFRDIFTIKGLTREQMRAMRTLTYTDNSNEKTETNKEEGVNYEKEEECMLRVVVVVEVEVETKM